MRRRRPVPSLRDRIIELSRLPIDARIAVIAKMTPADMIMIDAAFEIWVHEGQIAPAGEGWRTWLMMAGRGYGKTRAGAEWITALATQRGRPVRIALVAATEGEARKIMVEGESGLIAVGRRRFKRPRWEPSLGRLTWPGGSQAQIFSGENPDGLRGPQHDFAWCDELAKWAHPDSTWDNLQLGLRSGPRPRALVTTTPRPIPLLRRIGAEPWTVTTHGRTSDNISMSERFVSIMTATYGGTRLGRQELDGELIEDIEGALWTRETIEKCRTPLPGKEGPGVGGAEGASGIGSPGSLRSHPPLTPPCQGGGFFRRIVVGVDPPASAAGTCGISVCGLGRNGIYYVLADESADGLSPAGWARAAARTARAWGADRVIAEANQGGDMVKAVLKAAAPSLPLRLVHASRGKVARAEPVAALFESGEAKLAGRFPALEDELAGLVAGGRYEGPGRSPDRADAMVWAMTFLMAPGREPRVRGL